MKRVLVGLLLVAAQSPAWAQCVNYPNTLTNGTVANADQVMANFNAVNNCAAPITNPTFSGNVGVGIAPTAALIVKANSQAANTSEGSPGILSVTTGTNGQSIYMSYDGTHDWGFLESSKSGAIVPLLLQPRGGGVAINMMANTTMAFQVNGSAGGIYGWMTFSDQRLKKNVQDLDLGLSAIMKLRPVSFTWKAVGERSMGRELTLPLDQRQIGFIAQDAYKVIPEAVSAPQNDSELYQMQSDKIIPVLVKAIQEQQAEIDLLKSKLKAE